MSARVQVAVIDCGGANLGSVCHALTRLGAVPVPTSDAATIAAADRVLLPGVGAAAPAMQRLREAGLDTLIPRLQQPLLGICLGMQLLYERSEEGDCDCLGMLPGVVRAMTPAPGVRVPHMGWNRLERCSDSPLLDGLEADAHAYFVHGYAVGVDAHCAASSTHGARFAAVVQRGLVFGAQFHPERSAATGARMLRNFLAVAA